MSDTFGLLELPELTTDVPAGDPTLAKIGSFIQAVVNSDLTAAWQTVHPRPGDEAIRSVFFEDPEVGSFNDKFLPALFIWRVRGEQTDMALERYEDWSEVSALWVPPSGTFATNTRRANIVNAIAKSVGANLLRGRHPAWVDVGDTDQHAAPIVADDDCILLAKATAIAPVSYASGDLDGVVGAQVMAPKRQLRLAFATTIAPAYDTSAPVVVTAKRWTGESATFSLYPPSNLGGTADLPEDVSQVESVAVPAQLSELGSIRLGNRARTGIGSELGIRANVEEARLSRWRPHKLQIDVLDGDSRVTERLSYLGVLLSLSVRERLLTDLSAHPELYHQGYGVTAEVIGDDAFETTGQFD